MNESAKIVKIIRTTYAPDKSYANVFVRLDDGSEAVVYVGGSVEIWFANNKINARVKRKAA